MKLLISPLFDSRCLLDVALMYCFAVIHESVCSACDVGARVNAKDNKWLTPLHRAVASCSEVLQSYHNLYMCIQEVFAQTVLPKKQDCCNTDILSGDGSHKNQYAIKLKN